jgi:16S rRNA (guanine527-N7)-methyltransferase
LTSPAALLDLLDLFALSPTPLDRDGAEVLACYLDLLARWSARINLTGLRDPSTAAEGLLYDAVEVAPLISQGARVIDVGAGAGGLAAALTIIRPDLGIRLCEPRQKRAAFLRKARRELGFDRWEVVQERAEAIAEGDADATYAQAVMPPQQWLPLGRSLVRDNGAVLCLTAAPVPPEAIPADLKLRVRRTYRLPRSGAPREVTLFRAPGAATISDS